MLEHGVKGQVVVEELLKRLDKFTLGPFDSISLPSAGIDHIVLGTY